MDDSHFDAVTKHLSRLSGRRALLGALAALPLASGLREILSSDEAAAHGRRKRRKKRHKHGKGRRRKHQKNGKKKPCTPEAASQTCAGRCGSVTNNCQQAVDCEPCCTLKPTDDLQAAIDQAPDGATLRLCAGTWVVPETLEIAKPLTVVGAGAEQTILDGDDARRVLQITGDEEVTLQALTITGGNDTADAGGGGILNYATLTLRDVRLTGNTSQNSRGGGICNDFGSLTLENGSLVQGNTGYFGGGVANFGGTVTLASGSTVETNTAFLGGGVHSAAGTVTLASGSTVQGNEAVGGGGIYATGATVTLASGSTVQGNEAEDGGGIYATGATVTLASGSTVKGNTASLGGGVFNVSGMMIVEDGALICGNSEQQCEGDIDGACPNPPSGVCPS